MFAHQAADAGAFRTEHQRHIAHGHGVGQTLLAVTGQRDAPEAAFGQLMHDRAGNLKMADGYRVLIRIENYGGSGDTVAALF